MIRHKRLVFVHADGLHQIIGHSGDLGKHKIPVVMPPIDLRGRTIEFSSLYKVTPRAAYFKAPMLPVARNTFHEEQK